MTPEFERMPSAYLGSNVVITNSGRPRTQNGSL